MWAKAINSNVVFVFCIRFQIYVRKIIIIVIKSWGGIFELWNRVAGRVISFIKGA